MIFQKLFNPRIKVPADMHSCYFFPPLLLNIHVEVPVWVCLGSPWPNFIRGMNNLVCNYLVLFLQSITQSRSSSDLRWRCACAWTRRKSRNV